VELIQLWQVFRRWWFLIVIPTAIALLWSLPALPNAVSPPETYGGSIRFTAAAPPSEANAIAAETDSLPRSGTYEDTAYVPWLASEYVVVNLQRWVTSSSFAEEVSLVLDEQGLDIAADDVQQSFAADSARSILTVFFGWDDEAELEAIMQASIEVLQERNQSYFPQFASQPAEVVPLDDVEVVHTVPPITTRLNPFIRMLLGTTVGVGLAALASYLDDRIYDIGDIEDLPVLASIPRE
jgi:capsular polysaccharide biosynthesis protein